MYLHVHVLLTNNKLQELLVQLQLLNLCNFIQLHKQASYSTFFLLNYTVGEACEHLSLVMGISLYTTLELPIKTENVLKKIFLKYYVYVS